MSNTSFFINYTLRLLFTHLILVGLGSVILFTVHTISFETIKENVNASSIIIHKEHGYYDVFHNNFHFGKNEYRQFCLDGFSDAIMLMEACNTGKDDILNASILNKYTTNGKHPCDAILNYTENHNSKGGSYGRYWHGYLVTLIPSLTLMDLSQIRILNFCLFSILIITIAYLSYKKIDLTSSLLFILTLVFGGFFVVPYSMQFSSVFYVSFIASSVLLTFDNYWLKGYRAIILFFIVGALTSFVDLLTAPIVTLGFPLIFFMLLRKKVRYNDLFILCFVWALGYGLMWLSKWLLVYYLTDYDIISDALDASESRLGNNESLLRVFGKVIVRTPISDWFVILFAFVFWLLGMKNKTRIKENLWLLLIAIIPVVWLCLLRNHTLLHFWFSWRNMFVFVYAVLLFLIRTTNISQTKKILRLTILPKCVMNSNK